MIAGALARFGPKAKDAIPHLIVMAKMEIKDRRIESAKGSALIALGKMGSEATKESVEVLVQVLRDKELPNYLREQAARSLGELGPKVAKEAIPALVETLVEARIGSPVFVDSLAAMGKDAVPHLIPFVKRENQKKFRVRDTVREQILAIFEKLGPQAKEALEVVKAIRSERNPIGPAAERALESILREPEKK
jgi:HEAT repeat protein